MSEEIREYLEKFRELQGRQYQKQNMLIENFRMFLYGAAVGVLGNLLVSFLIEYFKQKALQIEQ